MNSKIAWLKVIADIFHFILHFGGFITFNLGWDIHKEEPDSVIGDWFMASSVLWITVICAKAAGYL